MQALFIAFIILMIGILSIKIATVVVTNKKTKNPIDNKIQIVKYEDILYEAIDDNVKGYPGVAYVNIGNNSHFVLSDYDICSEIVELFRMLNIHSMRTPVKLFKASDTEDLLYILTDAVKRGHIIKYVCIGEK